MSSKGPRPTRKPPVGPRLIAQDFSKNLPSWAASPGVDAHGDVHERACDVAVPVDADQVPQIWRETGAGEEEPLAAFDSPVRDSSKSTFSGTLPAAPAVPMVTVSAVPLSPQTNLNVASVRGVVR